MKNDLQTIFNEYYGENIHQVKDFTKEQLKECIKDYLIDSGTKDYISDILVSQLNIGQMLNIIEKVIDVDSNIIYILLSNELLEY